MIAAQTYEFVDSLVLSGCHNHSTPDRKLRRIKIQGFGKKELHLMKLEVVTISSHKSGWCVT